MSYILDSLKKSDQERQAHSNPIHHSPVFVDPGVRPSTRLLLAIGVLIVAVVFAFSVIKFGGLSSQALDEPAGELDISREAPQKVVEPLEATDSGAILKAKEVLFLEKIPPKIIPTPLKSEEDRKLQADDKPLVDKKSLAMTPVAGDKVKASTLEGGLENTIDTQSQALYLAHAKTKEPRGEPGEAVANLYRQKAEDLQVESKEPRDIIEPPADEILQAPLAPSDNSNANNGIPVIYEVNRLVQQSIPAIDYGAHVYATDNASGFVILNGSKRRAGERMRNGVYVEQVNESSVILSFQGVVFSLPAMQSWQP